MAEPLLVPKRTSLFESMGSQIALIVCALLIICIGVTLQIVVVALNAQLANDVRFCVEARGPFNGALVPKVIFFVRFS